MAEPIAAEFYGLAHGGEGIARHEKRLLFVPYVMPGERALVNIIQESKTWLRGELVELLDASPDRVLPPCPFFGPCKGCQLQHIAYARQLALKEELVRDQLARFGRLPDVPVRPIAGMANPWNYRNRSQLRPAGGSALGIQAHGAAEPTPIDACLLFHPLIDDLFVALDVELAGLERVCLRAGTRTGQQLIMFEMAGSEAFELELEMPASVVVQPGAGDLVLLAGDEWLEEEFGGRLVRYSALSPFPLNTEQAEALLKTVREYLQPAGEEVLLDAGSGVGLVTLALQDAVAGSVAVEENPWAVADFLHNVGEDGNAGVIEAPLVEGLAEIEGGVDLAVVSAGVDSLGPAVLGELRRLAPARIVYVGGDATPLARDAAGLMEAGYRLVEVQPFDMMPQTYRVAVAALWEASPEHR